MTHWIVNGDLSNPISDAAPWKGPDGTSYPGGWSKGSPQGVAAGFVAVVETPQPTDATQSWSSAVQMVSGVPTVVWTGTPLTLAQAQEAALRALDRAASTAQDAPVTISALGLTTSFALQWHGTITGTAFAASQTPSLVVPWQASDGETHPLNSTQTAKLFASCVAYTQAVFANQAAHVAAINALATVAAAQAHDVSTGWPATTV